MELLGSDNLTEAECWQRLLETWFGRLALSVEALPAILPVEYRVDGDELAICLGQYRVKEHSINNTVVAFAADAVDHATQSGWTVQVQGRTRLHNPDALSIRCGQHDRGQIIYLTPSTIAGQTLQLCPFGQALPGSDSL